MRFVKVAGPAALGLFVLVTGFVYDAFFTGVPYQDPTPEILSRWEYHSSVASLLYRTGAVILLAGIAAAPVIWRLTGTPRE